MKGLVRTIGILVLLGVLGFVAYRVLIGGSTVSWNQRLTVIVDTPAGEVRGASVVEITGVAGPELCREHGISTASFYEWRSRYRKPQDGAGTLSQLGQDSAAWNLPLAELPLDAMSRFEPQTIVDRPAAVVS